MRTMFIENKRELDFSRLGQKKSEKLELVHMYGKQLKYNLLVALIIMLLLLMMQLENFGFIALDRNVTCLLLLRSGKLWLRMRQKN